MKVKLTIQKIAGIFSTATLITASVLPDTMHIPMPARPWIFLVTITWIMLEVSGVFVS
jgi:hypothetical protein